MKWLAIKRSCLSVQTSLFRLVTIKECLTLARGNCLQCLHAGTCLPFICFKQMLFGGACILGSHQVLYIFLLLNINSSTQETRLKATGANRSSSILQQHQRELANLFYTRVTCQALVLSALLALECHVLVSEKPLALTLSLLLANLVQCLLAKFHLACTSMHETMQAKISEIKCPGHSVSFQLSVCVMTSPCSLCRRLSLSLFLCSCGECYD